MSAVEKALFGRLIKGGCCVAPAHEIARAAYLAALDDLAEHSGAMVDAMEECYCANAPDGPEHNVPWRLLLKAAIAAKRAEIEGGS